MTTLSSPEMLTNALNALVLSDSEQKELNKQLATHTRKFFQTQIRQQKDIHGKAYAKRKRRKITLDSKSGKAKVNDKMLLGFSKALKTQSTSDGFEIGFAGRLANIVREHNEGAQITFTTRIDGFLNSKTNRWEGGTKVQSSYELTKRTVIGWTPQLEKELMALIADKFTQQTA